MKKLVSAILLSLLLICGVFASTNTQVLPSLSHGIPLIGHVDGYCVISVSSIQRTSASDPEGMPFAITDSTIKYNASDIKTGRAIGYWTFATNESYVTIKFEPQSLTHTEDNTRKLDYFMTFMYEYKGLNEAVFSGYIVTSSKTGKALKVEGAQPTLKTAFDDTQLSNSIVVQNTAPLPIISVDKDIRIMLDSADYDVTDDIKFPIGYYRATVKITIQGGV